MEFKLKAAPNENDLFNVPPNVYRLTAGPNSISPVSITSLKYDSASAL